MLQIEHLKACSEVASQRTINWQRFCQKDEGVLPFLVQASISLHEAVSPVLLQLLQCALCGAKGLQLQQAATGGAPPGGGAAASPTKHKKEKDKEKDKGEGEHKVVLLCIIYK